MPDRPRHLVKRPGDVASRPVMNAEDQGEQKRLVGGNLLGQPLERGLKGNAHIAGRQELVGRLGQRRTRLRRRELDGLGDRESTPHCGRNGFGQLPHLLVERAGVRHRLPSSPGADRNRGSEPAHRRGHRPSE